MKICDCHHAADGSTVRAAGKVTFSDTCEDFDLCHSCAEKVREFITGGHGSKRAGNITDIKKPKKKRPEGVSSSNGVNKGDS